MSATGDLAAEIRRHLEDFNPAMDDIYTIPDPLAADLIAAGWGQLGPWRRALDNSDCSYRGMLVQRDNLREQNELNTRRWMLADERIEKLRDELADMTEQRDRARATAVALENELAAANHEPYLEAMQLQPGDEDYTPPDRSGVWPEFVGLFPKATTQGAET